MEKYYYIVDLEVVKKGTDYIFGFINISRIRYEKFEEIFADQITDERFLFDNSRGYTIDKKLYKKYKSFFDKEIPFGFDFNLFQYSVRLSGEEISKYHKNYYEVLPSPFKKVNDGL